MGDIIDQLGSLQQSTVSRNTRRSEKWLMNKFRNVEPQYLKTSVDIGKMYLFRYKPKYEKTLPFWDANPLVIPIDYYNNGFLGLNLHYLPPQLRVQLLDKLDSSVKGKNERAAMEISYSLLKGASNLKLFQPTVKRYLYSYVQSKFAFIPRDQWINAASLPLARFNKKSNTAVYRHSRGMI